MEFPEIVKFESKLKLPKKEMKNNMYGHKNFYCPKHLQKFKF